MSSALYLGCVVLGVVVLNNDQANTKASVSKGLRILVAVLVAFVLMIVVAGIFTRVELKPRQTETEGDTKPMPATRVVGDASIYTSWSLTQPLT